MTGIERLRELADDMSVQSLCCALLDGKQEHWNAQCWAGMTVNGMLRTIANQIEAEQEERVTRRVEDREAAEWVREHGGLDEVRRDFQDAANQRVELCAALGVDLDTGWADATCVMRDRLMPDGMEWPRFDSGDLVDFGDVAARDDGEPAVVDKIVFYGDQWRLYDQYACEINEDMMGPGERVERAAPKVLDKDGVEIRVGDTVWHEDGTELRVLGFKHEEDGERIVSVEYTGGPTNWSKVRSLSLTHQRPDSWERLEDDAGKNPFDYCKDVGHRLDTCENSEAYKARDIVRRAKALGADDGR